MTEQNGKKIGIRNGKSSLGDARGAGKNRKFTLVELLIVIAVIAMLTAMLLPALSKAKDKAVSISCLGNIRQIGTALHSYYLDNADWYPAYYSNQRLLQGYEYHFLQVYFRIRTPFSLDSAPKDNTQFGTDNNAMTSIVKTMQDQYRAWICPDSWPYVPVRQPHTSYAFIVSQNLTSDGRRSATAMAGWKILQARCPEAKIAAMDGRSVLKNAGIGTSVNNWNILLPGAGKSPGAVPLGIASQMAADEYYNGRHGGRLNLAFLDAHAESVPPAKPAREYYTDMSGGSKMFRPLTQ